MSYKQIYDRQVVTRKHACNKYCCSMRHFWAKPSPVELSTSKLTRRKTSPIKFPQKTSFALCLASMLMGVYCRRAQCKNCGSEPKSFPFETPFDKIEKLRGWQTAFYKTCTWFWNFCQTLKLSVFFIIRNCSWKPSFLTWISKTVE